MYDEVLTAFGESSDIDSVIMIVGDPMPGISDIISKHISKGKLIVTVMLGGGKAEAAERAKLGGQKIPTYPDSARGAKALSALTRYAVWRRSHT